MNSPIAASTSLESRIVSLIVAIAPDIDPTTIDANVELRAQFDFDSMDFLNLAAALHKTFGIDIPERDYHDLRSVAGCAAYLRGRLPEWAPEGGAAESPRMKDR